MNDSTKNAFAVIMAGGAGTRFWPLSRRSRPKQLLALAGGNESLVAAAVRRLTPVIAPERVLVVTGAAILDATVQALPNVPRENFLVEPVGRNTAPCIGWAATHVRRRDPNGILVVIAADQFIHDEAPYLRMLETAIAAAARGALVTCGIRPTRPETGYGYVEVGAAEAAGAFRVARFVEKPDLARAKTFLESGRFLWNSGMFFFRADSVLAAIDTHLPRLGATLRLFDEAAQAGNEDEAVRKHFASIEGVSIDYGVMEKAADVLVVPGDFGWSDLGSWLTAWELAEKDAHANVLRGKTVAIDSTACFVQGRSDKVIALVGVKDLVVVDTGDALLIMPKARSQEVKQVVEALEQSKGTSFL